MVNTSQGLSYDQAGLSLVELMIALVLGLLISTGVVSLFISSKQSYQAQDAISQVQENARFAQEFIARDARMAGYSGCSNDMPTANTVENAGANAGNFTRGVEGIDGDSTTIPARFTDALAGSDVLILHTTQLNSELVVNNHNPNAAQINVTNAHALKPGDIMMVVDSNCSSRGIFVMTGPTNNNDNASNVVHNTGKTFSYSDGSTGVGNCSKALKGDFDCSSTASASSTAYTDGSSVFSISTVAYYIRDPAQDATLTSPTLYRVSFNSGFQSAGGADTYEPMVEGVGALDVLYGVWDGGQLHYKPASSVANDEWEKVHSIRLNVLAESLTELDGAPLQRSFVRTVQLRNRT